MQLLPSLRILCYHSITDLTGSSLAKYGVPADLLDHQIKTLLEHGYKFLDPECLIDAIAGRFAIKSDIVLLTFDDCYRDLLTCAVPILQRYGVKAILFPVSQHIGGSNVWDKRLGSPSLELLNASELRQLQSDGMVIGCHSRTHLKLTDIPDDQLAEEIHGSFDDLVALGLNPIPVLAYPYGVYNERVKQQARASGIKVGLTVTPGIVQANNDPLQIPRIEIFPSDTGPEFLKRVTRLRVAKKVRRSSINSQITDSRLSECSDVTIVMLSCGRYDLLDATVRSFFRINKHPIREILISEDSGDPAAYKQLNEIFDPYDVQVTGFFHSNCEGINACMDELYSQVQTEYILHLEDDWLCTATSGDFIRRAKEVLLADDKVLQVWLRPPFDCNGHPLEDTCLHTPHAQYRLLTTGHRRKWHGYSNNPTLRRKRDYLLLGPGGYRAMSQGNSGWSEAAVGQFYFERGFRAAVLVEPDAGFIHIGGARSVASTSQGSRSLWSSPPSFRELHAELAYALERNESLNSELHHLRDLLAKGPTEPVPASDTLLAACSDFSRLQLLVVDGTGRSGTSALVRAIAARSDVAPTPEGGAPLINAFADFLVSYEEISPNRDYHRNRYKVSPEERYALFRAALYRAATGVDRSAAHDPRIKYVVAKTWPSRANMHRFLDLFPGMCVFYAIRNGIEVVASTMRYAPMSGISFEQACIDWAEGIELDKALFSNYALVRHEQLVNDPERTFALTFERLGLTYDPAPAQFISSELFNSSFDKPSSGARVRNIFAARQSAWLQWSPKERDIFRGICGPTMETLGYSIPQDASPAMITMSVGN